MDPAEQKRSVPRRSISTSRRARRSGRDWSCTLIWLLGCSLIVFGVDVSRSHGQSRFDQIRSSVNAPPVVDPHDHRRNERRDSHETCRHGNWKSTCGLCDDDDDDQSFADALLSSLFTGMVRSAFGTDDEPGSVETIGYSYNEETFEQPTYFAHYPYADGYDGYLMREAFVPARPQTGAMRFRFNYASDFDDIEMFSGSALIESNGGWGLDGEITFLTESIPNAARDELHLGDLNLLYRIASGERAILRAGIGTNWLHDAGSTDFGVNGTLLLDVFPRKPLTWTSQVDLGRIGSTSAIHLETTLGYSWEHIELFGGFDYRRIGSVDLAGPMFGIRGWW